MEGVRVVGLDVAESHGYGVGKGVVAKKAAEEVGSDSAGGHGGMDIVFEGFQDK